MYIEKELINFTENLKTIPGCTKVPLIFLSLYITDSAFVTC